MNASWSARVLITGASSQIGYFLLPRLQAAGFRYTAISRHPARDENWLQLDLQQAVPTLEAPTILFHCAGLPLLADLLTRLPDDAPLQHIVAFSSTSRLSKTDSPNPKEQAIAQQLATAEMDVLAYCRMKNIPCALFRPTLIYGCGQDRNISFIARFIQRFGFFPVIGAAKGLRQPVHADDLAAACLQVLDIRITRQQIYNLSGGETLSYRLMVETVFRHLGRKPRIISLPPSLFRLLVALLRWLPPFRHVSTVMVMRMEQDLCFDHSAAHHDFGYQPRAFSTASLSMEKRSRRPGFNR